MKVATSIYYIECMEQGKIKIVPHKPGGKTYKYMSRNEAVDFMKGFRVCNPQWKIRLCKRTTTETAGPWLTDKISNPSIWKDEIKESIKNK